jgi:hypothetical protein
MGKDDGRGVVAGVGALQWVGDDGFAQGLAGLADGRRQSLT